MSADAQNTPRRRRKKLTIGDVFTWAAVAVLMVFTLFPFYWSLKTAFSSNRSLPRTATNLLPGEWSLGGFKRALGLQSTAEAIADGGSGADINFRTALWNSTIVSTMVTLCQVTFCSMAAYAFARFKFPGRNALFTLLLTALMIPPIFTFLPNFIFVKDLGLLNTHLGIAAPTLLMTPFAIFFLRQFYLGLPREVEEAAQIDGAGRLRTYWLMTRMTWSAISTLALLTFIDQWNQYLWPKQVGQAADKRVLAASMGYFRSQTPQGTPDWAGLMAATWVSALPILILLLVFGRKLVNSIQFSGIK